MELEVINLNKTYEGNSVFRIKDISFSLKKDI